jgi:hypothetical protein
MRDSGQAHRFERGAPRKRAPLDRASGARRSRSAKSPGGGAQACSRVPEPNPSKKEPRCHPRCSRMDTGGGLFAQQVLKGGAEREEVGGREVDDFPPRERREKGGEPAAGFFLGEKSLTVINRLRSSISVVVL